RPRVPVRIRRGAVVDDPRVLRPRPPPLVGDPVLLGLGLASRRLVDAVLVDPAVDPRATGGRAVILERVVAGQERSVRGATADLLQHRFGVRLVVLALNWVVPDEVEDRPVLRIIGP